MTSKRRSFTKAEIEEFAREGWHFGPGLDWRQFVGKGKPQDTDQPTTETPPAASSEPDVDEQT